MARSFEFAGAQFDVAGDAALFWPAQKMLIVADLHLEKASAYAANGQMLPPYDSLATLEAVSRLARHHGAHSILSLGDNFHDGDGEARIGGAAASLLLRLNQKYHWIWVVGNHDPALFLPWGGESLVEMVRGGITFRHEARPDSTEPEISGHFHPKFRQQIRGRMVSRRCFLISNNKLILPAFGALTGGMDCTDIAFDSVFAADISRTALVPGANTIHRFRLQNAMI
jgi:uncharacterized protein